MQWFSKNYNFNHRDRCPSGKERKYLSCFLTFRKLHKNCKLHMLTSRNARLKNIYPVWLRRNILNSPSHKNSPPPHKISLWSHLWPSAVAMLENVCTEILWTAYETYHNTLLPTRVNFPHTKCVIRKEFFLPRNGYQYICIFLWEGGQTIRKYHLLDMFPCTSSLYRNTMGNKHQVKQNIKFLFLLSVYFLIYLISLNIIY